MLNLMDVMKATNLNALKNEDGGEDIDAEAAQAFGFLFAQLVLTDPNDAKVDMPAADGVVLDVESQSASADEAAQVLVNANQTNDIVLSQATDDELQPIFDSVDYPSKMDALALEGLAEMEHPMQTLDVSMRPILDEALEEVGTRPEALARSATETTRTSPSILEAMVEAHIRQVSEKNKFEFSQNLPEAPSDQAIQESAASIVSQAPKDVGLPENNHEITLKTDVAKPDWSSKFNQQIMWFGQQKIDKATLHLHPQELGPLQIQLKMDNDKASLIVQADSQQVRHLIEQGLPQLKENFLQQGIELHQVHIESNHSNHSNERQAREQGSVLLDSGYEEELGQEQLVVRQSQGLVDYFA